MTYCVSRARRSVRRIGVIESLECRQLLAVSPLITEFMASNDRTLLDSDGRSSDWIEIYNPGELSVDLSGWHLTDNDSNLTKWTFPTLVLDPHAYLVVFASGNNRFGSELHTNFKLSASGEFLALVQADGVTISSGYAPEYPPQATDVSYGLSLDGQRKGFFPVPTPGAANIVDPVTDPARRVVINELMYHPSSEIDAEEFIELHNFGSSSVDLTGWAFTKGIHFQFPNVTIGAGDYLVVAADPDVATAKHPDLVNVVGPWDGRLSNSSETIVLADNTGSIVDKITYADEGDWGERVRGARDHGTRGWVWSDDHDGGGRSLELINPSTANEYGQSWAASVVDQGTPGAANSVVAVNLPPLVLDVIHSPVIPHSSDVVAVAARLLDETSGSEAELLWCVGTGSFNAVPMHDDGRSGDDIAGDGIVSGQIPAQPDGTVVEFYVHAWDSSGVDRTWPAPASDAGQVTNLLYQVDDRFEPTAPWVPGSPPVYYQIMTPAERNEFSGIDRQSDAQMNATFISVTGTDTDVRYNVGVRIRGSNSRDDDPPNNRVNLPSDRPLQNATALNINEKRIRNQIAGSALFRLAGLPAAEAKAVLMYSNGVNLYGDQLYAHVEPLNQDFVSNQFPVDDGGNLYKGRRSDESPPGGRGAGLAYFGEDPVAYSSYDKLTNESAADWSDVIRLTDVLNNTPDANYVEAVEQVIDVDQWLRFFATNVLLNNTEGGLVNGDDQGDDYAMYRGTADTRFKMVPHDLDTLFSKIDDGIFDMTGVPALERLITHPAVLPRYYAQLKDLAINVLTTERAEVTLREALRNVASVRDIDGIVRFLKDRADYVLAQIPDKSLTAQSALPVVGEFHRSTSDNVSLYGDVSDQTASVSVNGVPAQLTGLERTWTFDTQTVGHAETLVPRGATWSYLDNGTDQGTAWRDPAYRPNQDWKSGPAELGYGDNDERTVVGFGPNGNDKYITTYFRHEFDVTDVADIISIRLGLLRDDGAAVYLNGQEVIRDNLPADADFRTEAIDTVGGGDEETSYEFSIDPSYLVEGRNVIAVEVHQASPDSSDTSFSLELEATRRSEEVLPKLNPGVNRLLVESFSGSNGTGSRIDAQLIDIWYDNGHVQIQSGTLATGSVVWSAAEGPYQISGKLLVPPQGTLTIEPGTSVYFNENASLEIQGTLIAKGTPFDRIRFTSIPNAPFVPDTPNGASGLPDGPPHWDGIHFVNSIQPENAIAYADIEYAQDNDGAIGLKNSQALIDNITIRGTHLRMIHAESSSLILQNSTFPDMFAANEIPADLKLDNVSEHIKASGTIPRNGHFIIRNNRFGTNKGDNDVIDVDSGRRPDPIVQIVDNVFQGSGDEEIDLGGDAYIAGNLFMNVSKDDNTSDRGYANAISTGDAGADTTTVVSGNVFWNVDHAINLKNRAATLFENNTVVGVHDDFFDRFGNLNVGSAINFYVDEPGATPGTGAYVAGNIFWGTPRVFGNVDQDNTSSVLLFNQNLLPPELAEVPVGSRPDSVLALGVDNILGDPRFVDELLGDFRLGPGSPADASGPLGTEMGATAPAGINISNRPSMVSSLRDATLTVGGPGMSAYRYRLNGGLWSDDVLIGNGFAGKDTVRTANIRLVNLPPGQQTLEVMGQDFAGNWQSDPTTVSWLVNPAPRIVISEVMARNLGALQVGTSRPDYIEIHNTGGSGINLQGYGVSDNPDNPWKFTFTQDTIVQAGEYLVLYADSEDGQGVHLGFSLSSEGEGVYLSEPMGIGGDLIDSVTFGPQVSDLSISRIGPDEQWELSVPTPGDFNESQPTGDPKRLRINEWLAHDDSLADFIELYNEDTLPVALDGLYLTDELGGEPTRHQIRPLSFVAGRAFVALSAEQAENLSFKLSSDQEGLALLDQQQRLIDAVIFYPQTNNVSQGRFPDGTNDYAFFDLPTPGRANGSGVVGDFNADNVINAQDVGLMCLAVRSGSGNLQYDLTNNGHIDVSDFEKLIRDVLKTTSGDANLDGVFDSSDLVQVFQAGEYHDGLAGNSSWSTGDWNCDSEFDSSDLVVAFQAGVYRST